MTQGHVTVHIIELGKNLLNFPVHCLTDQEKLRALRFRYPKDAIHWSTCRSALRGILGREIGQSPASVPLVYTEFGKPVLAPRFDSIHFNLSHCEDLALVAISRDGPVGIDLESRARGSDLLQCEETFCHPLEIATLPAEEIARAYQLLRIWTSKEAVLKALGTGFSQPPERVQVHFNTSTRCTATSAPALAGLKEQVIHLLDHPKLENYGAALARVGSATQIQFKVEH